MLSEEATLEMMSVLEDVVIEAEIENIDCLVIGCKKSSDKNISYYIIGEKTDAKECINALINVAFQDVKH